MDIMNDLCQPKRLDFKDWFSAWKTEFSSLNDLSSNTLVLQVSGFRSDKLIENPLSLINPYFGRVYTSVIGKTPKMQPDKNGNRFRFDTFRPYGAILELQNPSAIYQIRTSDPGPYEVEERIPSLDIYSITPQKLLESTDNYNEVVIKLERDRENITISGLFIVDTELYTNEGEKLIDSAKRFALPVIILNKSRGIASVKEVY